MLKNRGYKGITLISLIVTIVVLLILAGVTINAITGNESAMEKATEARERDKQGAELDAIKLAVVNSVASGLNGLVDANVLKNELNGLIDETSRNAITTAKTSWIVTANSGLKYKIKQNGEVTLAEPVASIQFEKSSYEVKEGNKIMLNLIAKDKADNITEPVSVFYESDKPEIASVNKLTGEVEGKTVSDEKVTITVTADNFTTSCEVTVIENLITIGNAIDTNEYGNKVRIKNQDGTAGAVYSTEIEGTNNIVWRLFYKDSDYAYLISDSIAETLCPITATGYDSNATIASVSPLGKGLNYNLTTNDYLRRNNVAITAWFTDISNTSYWNKYKGTDATYAIGGVTAELYVASYNSVNGEDSIGVGYAIGGYYWQGLDNFSDQVSTIKHGIWRNSNSAYWIASPCCPTKSQQNNIYNYGAIENSGTGIRGVSTSNNIGIRPMIMIDKDTFNKKYITVDEN